MYGLVGLLVPLAHGPVAVIVTVLFASQLLGDVAVSIHLITEVSLRQMLIPAHLAGRANTAIQFLTLGVAPFGALLAGVIAEYVGVRFTLLIGISGVIAAGLWLLLSPVRRIRTPHPLGVAGVALGTLIGGPLGDRIGRKSVIWGSILGVVPFTLVLPHVDLLWTAILSVVIGMTLASASSAIIVYAFDLVPGKIGTIAGLFFGLSFGLAGVGAVALGWLADATSIDFVYEVCAFLPLIGLLTIFLPDLGRPMRRAPLGKPALETQA